MRASDITVIVAVPNPALRLNLASAVDLTAGFRVISQAADLPTT